MADSPSPSVATTSSPTTVAQTTEEVTEEISRSADSLADAIGASLPRVGIALGTIVVGYLVARLFRALLCRVLRRRHGPSFSNVMSRLASWFFLALVVGAALAVTFPSVQPVDLLAGLGFFSVAVGFAFQDILENTLSGVLLLFRQPFVAGDEICVDGNQGIVKEITIRETQIRQYDGQLMVVPNRDVYKNAIRVQTSQRTRRIEFTVGVAYDTDLEKAQEIIRAALEPVPEIGDYPEPTALVSLLNTSTIDIVVRCWVNAAQADALSALDAAIRAVKSSLDDAGIEMPSDIMIIEDRVYRESHRVPRPHPSPTRGAAMAGETDKVAGRAKQVAGDLTDDEELKAEGKADEASGSLKDTLSNAVDSAREAGERAAEKAKAKADQMRN